MITEIYFDFDGTLIDCRDRIYRLFGDLTQKLFGVYISKESYWEYRNLGFRQTQILNRLGIESGQAELFRTLWLKLIETKEYLDLDKPRPDAEDLLNYLCSQYTVYLISNRQSPENLFREIEQLKWSAYFKSIFTTEQICGKEDILQVQCKAKQEAVLISDTTEDLYAAQHLHIKDIAVKSGLEPWNKVLEARPWFGVEELREIKGWL